MGIDPRLPESVVRGHERGTAGLAERGAWDRRRQDDGPTVKCRTKKCPHFVLFSCRRLAKVPVCCNGRKGIASSKVLTSFSCVVLKATIFHLHHYIFIALDIMLKNIYINNFDSIYFLLLK